MLRICTVSGEQAISEEILAAVRAILDTEIQGFTVPPERLCPDSADVFISLTSRVKELSAQVPEEKIVGLNMAPAAEFFVQIAKIPRAELIYVVHFNRRGAESLIEYCVAAGIERERFFIIDYGGMPQEDVKDQFKTAKYIAGQQAVVGDGGSLYTRFGSALRQDAEVIVSRRIPTGDSIARLMRWVTNFEHRCLAQTAATKTQQLSTQIQEITAITSTVAESLAKHTETLSKLEASTVEEEKRLKELADVVQAIVKATENIQSFAETIKHISGQTNLLALNATIEAARVGEQGRGFAVVAKEVGKLAAESENTTKTIRSVIDNIQTAVRTIVPALEKLSGTTALNRGQFSTVVRESEKDKIALQSVFKAMDNISSVSQDILAEMTKLA